MPGAADVMPKSISKLEAADAPPAAAASETPAERKARLLKYKVDGQEKEVDLDSLPETELVKRFQMSEAAQRRMQEAAELRKTFDAYKQKLREDPFEAAKMLDPDLDIMELAQQRLIEQYEQSQLPEHEQQLRKLQRELEARDAKLQAIEAEKQAAAQAQLEQQVFEQTYKEFEAALNTEGVPRNRLAMAMMAELAEQSANFGIELTPAQMAAEVKERMSGLARQSFDGLKGEALAKYLGDDVVKEILRYSVEKARGTKPAAFNPEPQKAVAPVSKEDSVTPDFGKERLKDLRSWREFKRG